MALAGVSDVASRVARTLTDAEQTQAQRLLDSATALIQSHARQTLERVVDDTVVLPGTWGQTLTLPERPVVNVTSVTVDGQAAAGWDLVGADLRATSWDGPHATVQVVYTHGFDPVPADLSAVCVEVVTRVVDNPRVLQSESETIGSYSSSRTYGVVEAARGVYLSPRERAVVDRYRTRVLAL